MTSHCCQKSVYGLTLLSEDCVCHFIAITSVLLPCVAVRSVYDLKLLSVNVYDLTLLSEDCIWPHITIISVFITWFCCQKCVWPCIVVRNVYDFTLLSESVYDLTFSEFHKFPYLIQFNSWIISKTLKKAPISTTFSNLFYSSLQLCSSKIINFVNQFHGRSDEAILAFFV